MLISLLYALCLIFTVFGVFYLFSLLACYFLSGKNKGGIYTVIVHSGTTDELYDKVYSAFLQSGFFSPFAKRPIIVIDNNIPENVKCTCKFIVEPFSQVYFLKSEDSIKFDEFNFENK